MSSRASVERRERAGRCRSGLKLAGLTLLIALPLLGGCQTDRDPRTGGFIDGVDNLTSGGYDAFVEEKNVELETTQEESQVLEARARTIEAERDALDRELEDAARELKQLQDRLAAKQAELDATAQATEAQRRKLQRAQKKAQLAQTHLNEYRQDRTQSNEVSRKKVDDLKNLIGAIGAMVNELSS